MKASKDSPNVICSSFLLENNFDLSFDKVQFIVFSEYSIRAIYCNNNIILQIKLAGSSETTQHLIQEDYILNIHGCENITFQNCFSFP